MSATADQALAPASTGAAARKELPDQLPLQERSFQIPREDFRLVKGDDGHYRLTFPVSSETPIQRWYGEEVLSHDASAIRVDRLNRGAVMHLFNHDDDEPRGVVEGYRIQGKKLWVDVKFFKTAKAEELAAMIDGGYRNVSLLYAIHVTEEDVKKHRYTHTDWEVFETSSVSMPADASVGIGRDQESSALAKRSAQFGQFSIRKVRLERTEIPEVVPPTTAQPAAIQGATMADEIASAGASAEQEAARAAAAAAAAATATRAAAGNGGSPVVTATRAIEMEAERKVGIDNLCRANNIPDNIRDLWITGGASMTRVSDELLRIIQERGKNNPRSDAQLGLSPKEAKRFSVRNAIMAVANQNWSNAGFEAECTAEIAKRVGRVPETNKFYIPYEVQQRGIQNAVEALAFAMMKRDLVVATPGSGGYLVGTENIGFIELLRNMSVMYAMGTTRLSGLQGNVTIPKQSAAGTAFWLSSESTAITESQPTFVQVAMAPKNVGGYTEISRQLLLQSDPSAEGLVMADLAAVVSLAIDLAGLNGSGASGQPLGILQTPGIGSVTGTSLDFADIIEFLTDVFAGNALSASSGFVTTGAVAGLLMARVKYASTASPIWEGGLPEGRIQGHRAMASNQMPVATKLFGDFSKTVIGEWGVLEIEVNPFANFAAGIIGVRAMASVDVVVRYPTAYSAASSIT